MCAGSWARATHSDYNSVFYPTCGERTAQRAELRKMPEPPNDHDGLTVRMLGVRGTVPTPKHGGGRFGGNTACVEVVGRDGRLILDAGSGIRQLQTTPGDPLHLLLSHYHYDHVIGLPFFAPLADPDQPVTIYGPELESEWSPARCLAELIRPPLFPLSWDQLASAVDVQRIDGAPLEIAGMAVTSCRLNHPGGAFAYRVEGGSRSVVYACDHGPGDAERDQALSLLAKDADLLILDAQYTPEELPAHRDWGHGSWVEATAIAEAAGVGLLLLFHYDPDHDDATLETIGEAARARFAATEMAREGMQIEL